jgi:hypothetical protein
LLSISGAQADILAVETQQIEQKEHQAGRVAEMLLAVIASIAVRSRLPAGGSRIRTIGPARERDGRGEGDPRPTIVVSRDPC